jgi:hypothetical protein
MGTQAYAQNANRNDPVPATPFQSLTAIERGFAVVPTAEPLTLFPQIREQLKDAPPFLRDSKAGINVRSYYRDNVSNASTGAAWNEAWAAGASVAFETGRLFDLISGGFVLYTSFPVYAPLDHDGTGLLKPGQQQYGVLGQLYGKVHIADTHEIIAGRYLYDTPFMNPHDNRMSPKTFYGYTIHGTFGDEASGGPALRYGGGYIAAMKERNSTEFISMSRAAGASEDRGVGVAGGMFSWGPMRLGAIDYYNQDTINIFYTEGKVGMNRGADFEATLAAQFANQNSTGTNLLNAGNYWVTNQFGVQGQIGLHDAILSAAYTVVNPGFNMQTPWSSNPFYTDAQIQSFNRAGEGAIMVGLSYVFAGGRPAGARGRVELQSRIPTQLGVSEGPVAARALRPGEDRPGRHPHHGGRGAPDPELRDQTLLTRPEPLSSIYLHFLPFFSISRRLRKWMRGG